MGSVSYSVESSYDPQTKMRLLRIVGDDIPDHVLLSIGRADPTGYLIPTAKNLVDIRNWRYQGSVIEVETQAAILTELFEEGMGEAYVWVTNPDIHGVALVFRRHMVKAGVGNPMPFTSLTAALDHLGVSMGDYLRTEAALAPVPLEE